MAIYYVRLRKNVSLTPDAVLKPSFYILDQTGRQINCKSCKPLAVIK